MKTLERLLKWAVAVGVLIKWAAVACMIGYLMLVGVYLMLTSADERAALASNRRVEAARTAESNAAPTTGRRAQESPR